MSILRKYGNLLRSNVPEEGKVSAPLDPNELLQKLQRMKKMAKSEQYKLPKMMKKIFLHPGFCKLMFDPGDNFPNLNNVIPEIYNLLRRQDNVRAMIDMLKSEPVDAFNQSHAEFLNNFVSLCIEELNNDISTAKKRREDGEITKSELAEFLEQSDGYTEELQVLLKRARKIVKQDAKYLRDKTGIPKELIIAAMLHCPEHKYITKYQISYYMQMVLNAMYDEAITLYGKHDSGFVPYPDTWKVFFSALFGKENVTNCAISILLEGMGKYKKYIDYEVVEMMWNSLTEFALQALNDTTDEKRVQMLDLYMKKIEKMFRNKHSNDLRFDLRTVSKINYPKLFDTLSKYINKITDIVEKVEE